MNFWALCAISAHLNVIAKHPWASLEVLEEHPKTHLPPPNMMLLEKLLETYYHPHFRLGQRTEIAEFN